jgi:hypothetical protein
MRWVDMELRRLSIQNCAAGVARDSGPGAFGDLPNLELKNPWPHGCPP